MGEDGLPSEKLTLQKQYWICETCRNLLDPIKDKYVRGPISGKEIMQIKLTDGSITHLLAEAMGKDGIRSSYLPEDSTIMINAEHGMHVYAQKTSSDAFKCIMLDSIIYAIAIQRSKGYSTSEFQTIYNQLSSKISKVIDVSDYEDTLSQFRINN